VSARPLNPEPFRIEPIFSPRLWGSRSLAPLFPDKTNLQEPLGEAWLSGVDCKVASGLFAEKALLDAWREMPPDWRGSRLTAGEQFPILMKFIFPTDKLSIQVHPDDAYAQAHEQAAGGRGKTEMWHAVSAEAAAEVLVGLKPGTDKRKFQDALQTNRVERLFQAHTVQPGDTFYIPAGTPHTIGPGMVLCEVQEYSDLTYRVYDYGRVDANGKARELHVEKALAVMRFGETIGAGKLRPLPARATGPKRTLLAACRYFAAERWEVVERCDSKSDGKAFELLAILSGRGRFEWSGAAADYNSGQCWFVPAAVGGMSIQPKDATAFIRAFVPDLADLRSKLKREGVEASAISRVVFD
jgi:mannose-6-phosphate isomerase